MNPIGHSSTVFCHDAPADTAHAVEDAGFDVWEIVGDGRHDVSQNLDAFRDALASVDLTAQLHAPISDCNLGSLVPEVRDLSVRRVERALRAAAQLDIRRVTVHPGNHSPHSRGRYPLLHEATRESLRALNAVAEDLGLELCLENMPHSWAFETCSMDQLADLARDTSLGMTYDYGHAHVAGCTEEFEVAAPRLANVHIHDNKGDVDAHLTLGDGTLDWKRVTRSLVRDGYQGTFVIESKSHESGVASLAKLRRLLQGT